MGDCFPTSNKNISTPQTKLGGKKYQKSSEQTKNRRKREENSIQKINYDALGLPNVNKCCYLNSILQILYAMPKLRQYLTNKIEDMSRKKQKARLPLNEMIASIFVEMRQIQSKRKKDILGNILNFIEEKFDLFRSGDEQDLKEVYNFIVEKICSQDQRIAQLLSYDVGCRCQKCSREIIFTCNLWKNDECGHCKIQWRKSVPKEPQYLAVVFGKKSSLRSEKFSIYNENNEEVLYQLIGFINYIGDGDSGHYKAQIKRQQKWIQVDDSFVKTKEHYCQEDQIKRLVFYEKKSK